jgi:hypothetical protein
MSIKILGSTRDKRTDTIVLYGKMSVLDYLQIVGNDFENFSIQRRRENHKAYRRLKQDVIDGALLPSISLAVKPTKVPDLLPLLEGAENAQDWTGLEAELMKGDLVDILDGLQRTYILTDIKESGHEFVEGQEVLAEFWFEQDLQNLIYRIIVLNAGQKPMSMRHQIELLFMSLREYLEKEIQGLKIYTERDNSRRRSARKYSLALIASGYHAFLSASAELKKDNIVASQLMDSNALDASEEELGESFTRFVSYLKKLSRIDEEVFRVYQEAQPEVQDGDIDEKDTLVANRHWIADENVFLSFFAAIAQFGKLEDKRPRIDDALDKLEDKLKAASVGDDPMHLHTFSDLKKGANPRRSNVGVATRKLITNGFKEFFRESGDIELDQCWQLAAD